MTLPIPSEMTAAVGQVLTAAAWNTMVRDAVNYLLNPPIFIGYQSVSQSLATSSFTSVSLDAEVVDPYGGHSTTTNNSRYISQIAGWYLLLGQVNYPSNATGLRANRFAINGAATTAPLNEVELGTNPSGAAIVPNFALQFLNVGDYAELQAFQNSGGALSLSSNNSFFAALWVHA